MKTTNENIRQRSYFIWNDMDITFAFFPDLKNIHQRRLHILFQIRFLIIIVISGHVNGQTKSYATSFKHLIVFT